MKITKFYHTLYMPFEFGELVKLHAQRWGLRDWSLTWQGLVSYTSGERLIEMYRFKLVCEDDSPVLDFVDALAVWFVPVEKLDFYSGNLITLDVYGDDDV